MSNIREVAEGPQVQSPNEEIYWIIDISKWGDNPTNLYTEAHDDTGADVAATILSGIPSAISPSEIKTPKVYNLTDGTTYKVQPQFTIGEQELECFFEIKTGVHGVQEGVQLESPDESIRWTLDISGIGSDPTNLVASAVDDLGVDVTATILSGSPEIVTSTLVKMPAVTNLTVGKKYLVSLVFTVDGNRVEGTFEVECLEE